MNRFAIFTSQPNDPELVAYHESGHAVVGWINGLQIKSIQQFSVEFYDNALTPVLKLLRENPQFLLSNDWREELAPAIRRYCEMLQAGYVAMHIQRPSISLLECEKLSGAYDSAMQRQLGMILEEDAPKRAEWFLEIVNSVHDCLSATPTWSAVTALARRLQESPNLTGEEAQAIIHQFVR